jgi:hypothetical protein
MPSADGGGRTPTDGSRRPEPRVHGPNRVTSPIWLPFLSAGSPSLPSDCSPRLAMPPNEGSAPPLADGPRRVWSSNDTSGRQDRPCFSTHDGLPKAPPSGPLIRLTPPRSAMRRGGVRVWSTSRVAFNRRDGASGCSGAQIAWALASTALQPASTCPGLVQKGARTQNGAPGIRPEDEARHRRAPRCHVPAQST